MTTEKEIVDTLEAYSNNYLNKAQFAIYINSKRVFIGKAKVYMTFGKAKGKIIDMFHNRYNNSGEKREDVSKLVDSLIKKGIIQIKESL